jgi:hypothetical protein
MVSFVFFLFSLVLAQPLLAAEGIAVNLVSVQWLEKNLRNADVLMLDASGPNRIGQEIPLPAATAAVGFAFRNTLATLDLV